MIRTIRLDLFVLLLVGLGLCSPVLANPFTGTPETPARVSHVEQAQGPLAVVGRALLTFQRETNRMIAEHMRAIREGETSAPLLIGVVLAFAYGVVHALGPGHGKVVVVSYFLSRDAQIMRGFLMGMQIAVFHVLSAAVMVALADLVLRQAFGSAPGEVAGVRLASYGLIALIGCSMLVQAVRRSRLRRAGIEVPDECCTHGHTTHQHRPSLTEPGAGERAREGALSLGVGLVPCTGAVLILLYAIANDILFAGVLLVVAIAAGMAITMGALGVLSIVARNAVAARVESGWEWAAALRHRHGLRRCARHNRARRRFVLGNSAIDISGSRTGHTEVSDHSADQRAVVHSGKVRRYRAAS
jgi:ABC-type nickel/cobalt efflux system permease component RcnA